jgi:hypothetical protein
VRSWIAAQDTVFRNCGGPNAQTHQPDLPAAANSSFPAIIKADRDYQIAAAYFYGQNWDEAEKRFVRISHDDTSPWQAIAALVALRCKLRKATLGSDQPEPPRDQLAVISADLDQLEKDPRMRDLRPAIWRMRGFVDFRLAPARRLDELAQSIEARERPDNLQQDLDDYTRLLDRAVAGDFDDDPQTPQSAGAPQISETLIAARNKNAMTDWILTFQNSYPSAKSHAFEKWQQTKSLPWLVACLANASPSDSHLPQLLSSAAQIDRTSPAYFTLIYQRARLLSVTNHPDQASNLLAQTISREASHPSPSTRNLFLAVLMKQARNLDEFLRYAPRQVSFITYDADNSDGSSVPARNDACKNGLAYSTPNSCANLKSPHPMFDSDAATLLTESLPTDLLAEAADNSRLNSHLRLQIVRSAWVRAILLQEEASAQKLTRSFSSLSPNLAPELKTYSAATTAEDRRFAATFLILHHPELHPYIAAGVERDTPPGEINPYHDNWWCSFAKFKSTIGYSEAFDYYHFYSNIKDPLSTLYPDAKSRQLTFLSPQDRDSAQKEFSNLTHLGSAPDWLITQVLQFAKSNPNDSRIPEALHNSIRAGHLGCPTPATAQLSKSAFQLLHKNYPHNPWTTRTPYWYR